MSIKNKHIGGTSVDAILLTFIKLVTTALGLIITRLLSEYLSVHDYGTYSQILLIVSTVASVTIFGMMDGMNYFYCSEQDTEKRERYIATIFALQCTIGTAAGCVIMLLSAPLCTYFDNSEVKGLIVFAASLPLFQNLLGIFQILLVSVGKARMLAVRNFVVSAIRLVAVFLVVTVVRNVAVVLVTTLILDIGQIVFFVMILRKSNCHIRLAKTDIHLIGKILRYCAPMAVFTMVNTLNRDMDKYLISMVTDTEMLAIYANASKQLPFDILTTSFCTVLIPHITRLISEQAKAEAAKLYKLFLEITYISTGILCCAALSAAPQFMQLLYSEKYSAGLTVFCIYILVDLFRFTNITLILSAAGKTSVLMIMGLGALVFNALLNIVLYSFMGFAGPASATLVATVVLGIVMLYFSAKVLSTRLLSFFDVKHLMLFAVESVILTVALSWLCRFLSGLGWHYFVVLAVIAGIYGAVMLLLNGKRLLSDMKHVNNISKSM